MSAARSSRRIVSGRLLAVVASIAAALGMTAQARSDGPVGVPPPPPAAAADGARAFVDVARVLQSPRCMNCHPVGDAPLQGDVSKPHVMNVTRASVEAGLACGTCHQERNSEAVGVKGGPPGAPKWGLPPKETPMVFEGRTLTALCEQLKDPARNGGKSLQALLEHVDHDPLVMWGWAPGGKRTLPPLAHQPFVAAFKIWVGSNGACP